MTLTLLLVLRERGGETALVGVCGREGVLGSILSGDGVLGSDDGGKDSGEGVLEISVVVDSVLGLLPGVTGISMGLSSLIPLGCVAAILIGGPFGACTGTWRPSVGGGGDLLLGD